MASRTKLAGLLAELETLRSAGAGSNGKQVTEHVKYIVDIVFHDIIAVDKVQSGSERSNLGSLKSCLGLLRMAVDNFDDVYTENGTSTIPFYFARLMQLFSLGIGRTCRDQLFLTLDKLLVSGGMHDSSVLTLLYSGICSLLSDVGEIVESLSTAPVPINRIVVLECFRGAKHKVAASIDVNQQTDQDCLFMSLHSEQDALAVGSACCRIIARIIDCAPLAVVTNTPPGALTAIGTLAPSAGEDDQILFLSALRAIASEMCPDTITPSRLMNMLETVISAHVLRGAKSPGEQWWYVVCSCLELVFVRLAESGCIHAKSSKLMSLLGSLLWQCGSDFGIKASLLSLVLLVSRSDSRTAPSALEIATSSWLSFSHTSQAEEQCIEAVVAIFRNAVEIRCSAGPQSGHRAKQARLDPDVASKEDLVLQPFTQAHCQPPANLDAADPLPALSGLQLVLRATSDASHKSAWRMCMPTVLLWAQWASTNVSSLPLMPAAMLLEAIEETLSCQCSRGLAPAMTDDLMASIIGIPLSALVGLPWAQHVVREAQGDSEAASEALAAVRQSALRSCILAWICCHQQKESLPENTSADVASLCQSVLRRCLSDSNPKARRVAVACIPMVSVQIGAGSPPVQDGLRPRARGALRLLTELVSDESMAVRISVARCLARIQLCLTQGQYGIMQALADQVRALQDIDGLSSRCTYLSSFSELLGSIETPGETPSVSVATINAEQEIAGQAGLAPPDLGPFWPLLTAGREHAEVRSAMIDFCRLWLGSGQSTTELSQCAEAIKCCLDLSLSSSKSIRTAVSELIFVLVKHGGLASYYTSIKAQAGHISGKEGELMLLKDLRDQLEANRQDGSQDIRGSLLACVAHACAAANTREGLWMGLVMIVDTLDDQNPCVRARTGEMLHSIAACRKIDVADMVTGQPRIMEYVGRRMSSKPQLLGELADALELRETQLAERLVPSVLPRLVISQDTQLLESLASQLGKSLKDMLVNYGHHTVAYILLEGTQDIDEYATFMNKHTGVEFDDLMRSSLRSVLREVMWCGGDYKRWFGRIPDASGAGLETCSGPPPELLENMQNNVLGCILRIHQGKDIPNHDIGAAVAEFLHKEQMVWLLTDLVGEKMKRAQEVEPAEQAQALRCLALMVVFIDFHLADFVPIMMTLLACATEALDPSVQVQALSVWRLFIRQLSVHAPDMLKINAVPIAVILSSSLEEGGLATQAAAPAMEELVLQNADGLAEVLCEFPPLPSVPALARVNQAIASARGDMSAPEQLHTLAHGLVPNRPGHYAAQPLAVKAVTLMEIKRFLQQHQEWRGALAGGSNQSSNAMHWHGALDFLVAVLLKSCDPEVRSALSSRVQLRCGECLGALGAVDPCKLDSVDNLKGALSKAQTADKICRSEQELAKEALKCLVRLLSGSSDLAVLEAATFGIQELLRHYGGDTTPSSGDWSLFSAAGEELQPILRPYLSTKYQMHQTIQSGSVPSPIFGMPDLSFRRWLFLWLKQLTDRMPSARSTVLRSCLGVARHDIPIMMLLLPHAVLLALADADLETVNLIALEIAEVLKCGSGAEPTQVDWQLFLQASFTLLDRLQDWVTRMDVSAVATISHSGKTPSSVEPTQGSFDSSKEAVEALLKAIDKRILTKAAFRCKAHARASQYFEAALRDEGMGGGLNPASRHASQYGEEDVSFLIDIYSELEEPDGLSGLIRLRKGGPTNSDMILAAERRGGWGEALTLYEQALQQEEGSQSRQQDSARDLTRNQAGHLTCLLHMGHLQAVLTQAEGLAAVASSSARTKLAVKAVAAAWRLGRWEVLEDCLKAAQEHPSFLEAEELWEVRLGQLIASIRVMDIGALHAQLKLARQEIMAPMSAAAMESHSRAYPHVVRLHMLQEVQDAVEYLPVLRGEQQTTGNKPNTLRALQNLHWPQRLACTQVSLATQEPILALRRQLAVLAGLHDQEGICWLMLARLSRKTCHLDTAAISCLEAITRGAEGALLEHAKLLWTTGETHRAISTVQEALQRGSVSASEGLTNLRTKTKLLLQLARWVAVTGQGGKDQVVMHFHNAIESGRTSEKNFFYYGKYLDQLMQDAKRRQLDAESNTKHMTDDRLGGKSKVVLGEEDHYLEILPEAVQNYAMAVKHGHKLIMQSLPRLLTLWYDFGSQFHVAKKNKFHVTSLEREQEQEYQLLSQTAEKIKSVMADACVNLPVYSWLMVLSQLTSRTCHPNPDVSALTKDIIITVTEAYPQQAVWALVAVSRSKFKQRSKSAAEILNTAKKRILTGKSKLSSGESQCREVFSQFPALVDQLISIANYKPGAKVRRFDLTREGGLSHVTRMNPNAVILPVLDMLTPELPIGGVADGAHNAFSGRYTTIESIRKEVDVMPSLQRPKKIVFNGSDGTKYMFLAKPNDDLRKDHRLMELATTLNRLFVKHPASRQRNLYLRTFNVVPLTEDCGIIQWINYTQGLRQCCSHTYTSLGIQDKHTLPTIKRIYESHEKSGSRKWTTHWYNEVMDMFPPVLHNWFLKVFATPAHWSNARLRFARTTAVWSMVGHVLGLGDRHGENLLIDKSTGDCVHVDFSCLFDKGLTLEKPEMVPFRLTQNLVDAFGPSGVEGVFRSACGITLQVLRAHRETILSILETFVYDPLVEWNKSSSAQRESGNSDNPQARDALRTTDGRLLGTLIGVSSRPSLPLSVEGHAHRLIEEATDHDNLGRMYIWWMIWY